MTVGRDWTRISDVQRLWTRVPDPVCISARMSHLWLSAHFRDKNKNYVAEILRTLGLFLIISVWGVYHPLPPCISDSKCLHCCVSRPTFKIASVLIKGEGDSLMLAKGLFHKKSSPCQCDTRDDTHLGKIRLEVTSPWAASELEIFYMRWFFILCLFLPHWNWHLKISPANLFCIVIFFLPPDCSLGVSAAGSSL